MLVRNREPVYRPILTVIDNLCILLIEVLLCKLDGNFPDYFTVLTDKLAAII